MFRRKTLLTTKEVKRRRPKVLQLTSTLDRDYCELSQEIRVTKTSVLLLNKPCLSVSFI